MRVITVIGARPQFVKAAAVSRHLRRRHEEILIHTGQHYDDDMSGRFFRELDIPEPDVNLGVGSGSHGEQTAAMLVGLERVIDDRRPDLVLVYGDTNSTLAGALAAAKLDIRVAHIEAGLRSFVRGMPEEVNRVTADHLSALLFCPSQSAADNLAREGIHEGVHVVGDVMFDALQMPAIRAREASRIVEQLALCERHYTLATVHRAHNVDDAARLGRIAAALNRIDEPIVFPVHPRTRKALDAIGWRPSPHVRVLDPLGYVDMIRLARSARVILTDSGGLQKEAYWLGVPCVTLRDETEWTETVDAGWNVLSGDDPDRIVRLARTLVPPLHRPALYGDGCAAAHIVEHLR
jgi:UDP-GlcNAc3NAcA epimerase